MGDHRVKQLSFHVDVVVPEYQYIIFEVLANLVDRFILEKRLEDIHLPLCLLIVGRDRYIPGFSLPKSE